MSSDVEWSEATLLRKDRKRTEVITRTRGGAKERRNTIYLMHMLSKSKIALSEHAANKASQMSRK